MHSDLHLHFTRATAEHRHEVAPGRLHTTIALRLAQQDEGDAVVRLAALDGVKPLEGPVLLALADGEPVAALSLDDGRVAADPFHSTAEAVELLQVRAHRRSDRRRFARLRAAA